MYDNQEYEFVKEIFEEAFPDKYQQLLNAGIIQFEIVNLLDICKEVFIQFPLSQNEENRLLQYAIIGAINDLV